MPRRFYLPSHNIRKPEWVARSPRRSSVSRRWIMVVLLVVVAAAVTWYRVTRPVSQRVPRTTTETETRPSEAAPGASARPDTKMPVGSRAPTVDNTIVAQREPVTRQAIRLQVLNGCGQKGLAGRLSAPLREMGFDVRETGNARRSDYVQSEVLDRVGNITLAFIVADSLGIHVSRVRTDVSGDLADIDVTLVVGRDYRELNLHFNGLSKE